MKKKRKNYPMIWLKDGTLIIPRTEKGYRKWKKYESQQTKQSNKN